MASTMRTFVFFAISAMVMELAMAATYNVGGTNGWDTSSDVQTWASSQTFTVGDTLVFQYSSTSHDVTEVSQSDYDNCVAGNAIQSYNDGNTTIALPSEGKRYFICGTPGHCGQGMKIEVDVLAASGSAPPPTTETPLGSPPPPTTGTPPATNSSPPPPTKSSPSSPTPSSAHKYSFTLAFGFALMVLLAQ